MKKVLIVMLLSLIFLILDNTLMPFLSIKGVYPSLLILFILSYSIINGSWEGLWIGIFAGFLQDIFFFNGVGLNSFANMIVCVIAGLIGKSIFREKIFLPIVSTYCLYILRSIIIFSILYIFGQISNVKNIFYAGFYDALLSVIFYKLVYNLCQKKFMQRDWKFGDWISII